MRVPLVLGAALTMAIGARAWACSPVPGYRAPTNVELIDKADLVVLTRIAGGPTLYLQDLPDDYEPRVVLKPLRAIKGTAPAMLAVEGIMADRRGRPFGREVTSLDRVHSSALWGACIRQAYPRGGLVLAVFAKEGTGYVQRRLPFARIAEDVATPSAVWVRAATLYARLLASHRGSDRRAAFAAERRRLMRGGADDRAIAADIGRYLAVASASRKLGTGSDGSS